MKSISQNVGVAIIGRVAANLIALIVVGILSRVLGPDGYGAYGTIFAYLSVVAIIADMGLYTLLARNISRFGADEARITGTLVALRLALVVAIGAAAIGIAWLLPYARDIRLGIALGTVAVVCSSLTQVLMGVFQKHLKLHLASIGDIITRAVQAGAVAYLASQGISSPLAYVGAVVAAELVHIFAITRFSKSIIPWRLTVDLDAWKAGLKESFPIAVSLVFVLLYFKLDTVLLSLMKPAGDVGIYSVAYKVLEVVIFLPAMYMGLIMPRLSKFASDRELFKREYQRAFDVLSLFALPAVAYIGIMSYRITALLGGDGYGESGAVLRILSVAIGLIFFGNLCGNALIALNLQKKAMWIYGIGAIFNVGLNLLLIPRYSYYATAWTTVATELLVTVLMLWLIAKEIGYYPSAARLAKAFCAGAIAGLLIYFFKNSLLLGTIVSLAYFPLLYLFKGFSLDELRKSFRPDSFGI